jgi:hypothetical protein
MTALCAHTCHYNTSINPTFNHRHNVPPNSAKQPPYITKLKHDNLRTSNILPLPRQYRGVLPCATPRQPQKSATFQHIIITRTTRIATRCADDEVCVNSPPSSPLLLFRNRCARGLPEDHLLLELLQSDESRDGLRAVPRRPCGRSLQLEWPSGFSTARLQDPRMSAPS